MAMFILAIPLSLSAQDFMLQGWYWDYPKPANPNGNPSTESTFAKTLNTRVADLASAGFTYVWLPPLSRASFGHNSNGYDPMDLYDFGGYGLGATGFGFDSDVSSLINAMNTHSINAVADVVYNHRDGGLPENNPSVEGWIENLTWAKVQSGDNAFPSDRFRCVLPLGGASGNGAGDYYIKIKSSSEHSNYHNKHYRIYTETNLIGWQNNPDASESEPNGGGDCGGQASTVISLGTNTQAWTDTGAGGCYTDEFKLTLSASDFNASGDSLYIYLSNYNGDYSDHFVYGIWNASASSDVVNSLIYQTYTDHNQHASGRGGMDYTYFKPNGNPTQLSGDWDWMWFYYDYDQFQPKTVDTLTAWTKWLWNDRGLRGFRMDAVKHFPEEFVGNLLDELHNSGINPGMVVGEFYDSNGALLKNWVDQVESFMNPGTLSAIDVRVFDFSLRQALKDACDAFGYDTRNVFQSGLVDGQGASGFQSVSFVNNHDFRDPGQSVQNDPLLAYAYIFTNNQVGLPCAYYPDYYGIPRPNAPTVNLKSDLDFLMNLHTTHIYQSTTVDYLNRFGTPYSSFYVSQNARENTSLLYQITDNQSGQDVIVAINFAGEPLDVYQEINMTNIDPAYATFTMMNGDDSGDFEVITANDELHIQVPARSYVIYLQDVPARTVLPVELVDFTARNQDDRVLLNWSVASETNFSHYEVERSFDAQEYQSIGRVEADASSNYDFNDTAIFEGKAYYRLRLVDFDGSYSFSMLRQIEKPVLNKRLKLYPTQTADQLSISSSEDKIMSVEVFNAEGVLSKKISDLLLESTVLSVSDLSSGVYKVRVRFLNGDSETGTFIRK